jgi:hypothetical protein
LYTVASPPPAGHAAAALVALTVLDAFGTT